MLVIEFEKLGRGENKRRLELPDNQNNLQIEKAVVKFARGYLVSKLVDAEVVDDVVYVSAGDRTVGVGTISKVDV